MSFWTVRTSRMPRFATGPIRFEGSDCEACSTCSIKIRNSGGDIALQLPAGKGYDLDLAASKIKTSNLSNFNGKTTEDEINGQLNGGGAKVTVDGGNGHITLTMK